MIQWHVYEEQVNNQCIKNCHFSTLAHCIYLDQTALSLYWNSSVTLQLTILFSNIRKRFQQISTSRVEKIRYAPGSRPGPGARVWAWPWESGHKGDLWPILSLGSDRNVSPESGPEGGWFSQKRSPNALPHSVTNPRPNGGFLPLKCWNNTRWRS